MAYGKVQGVAALCKELVAADGNFNSDSTPTERQVQAFLDDASALMNHEFARLGFTTPITDTDVTAILDPIAEWFAAAQAEGVRNVERSDWEGASEESKPAHWMQLYERAMERLTKANGLGLYVLGASKTRGLSYGLHAGGLSEDEKDTIEADSDFIQPTFKRSMMEYKVTDWTTV